MAPAKKPGGIIYPTLTCFDDTFEIVLGIAKVNQRRAMKLTVVHALCLFPDGRLAAHAWVEEGTRCYFAGIVEGKKRFFKLYRPEYYKRIRPQEMTRYPVKDIFQGKHAGDMRHTGPWKEKYQPYLRQSEEERP